MNTPTPPVPRAARAPAARVLVSFLACIAALFSPGASSGRADLVGPDGISYPDWRKAGIAGGIPSVAQVKTLADFGGATWTNIAPALQSGVDWLKNNGGGALFIPAGSYYLDSVVTITGDNIVIRGAGAGSTKIYFRPAADASGMYVGGITFKGAGNISSAIGLAADAPRGANTLSLPSGHGFVVGDTLRLECPGVPAGVENACVEPWLMRQNLYRVSAVSGNTVTLDGVLRIDFPVAEGARVKKWRGIRRGGVENLYFEQTTSAWHSSITFTDAWECWARGVTVFRTGRFPIYMINAKHGEIRDCVMQEARNKGLGGTAYVGWDACHDSLMENVTTHGMRHAPLFQWSASGCVIRNSTFHHSDLQWHAGWTHENLVENCRVSSTLGNGGNGYGGYSTTPEDVEHGPNGPRNVVYGCDISSRKDGLWFGGENKDWIVVYNRVVAVSGSGFFLRERSDGHLLEVNHVQQRTPNGQPGVRLDTANISGVQVNDSLFRNITASSIVGGSGAAGATQSGNTAAAGSGWIAVTNRDFEAGNLSPWDVTADGGMSAVSAAAAANGAWGLRVTDASTAAGSSLATARFAATAGLDYQAWFDARMVSGWGIAVYLQFYNASNQELGAAQLLEVPPTATAWRGYLLQATAPAGTTQVRVWVHSFNAATCVADFDNFELNSVVARPTPGVPSIFNSQRGL